VLNLLQSVLRDTFLLLQEKDIETTTRGSFFIVGEILGIVPLFNNGTIPSISPFSSERVRTAHRQKKEP
jgi:hypothetical protein